MDDATSPEAARKLSLANPALRCEKEIAADAPVGIV